MVPLLPFTYGCSVRRYVGESARKQPERYAFDAPLVDGAAAAARDAAVTVLRVCRAHGRKMRTSRYAARCRRT